MKVKMMQHMWVVLVVVLLVGGLTACSGPAVDFPKPTPEPGTGSVVGRIVSRESGEPLANTIIRAGKVTRETGVPLYVIDGAHSPGDISDEEGIFLMENMLPGEYVFVVGELLGINEVIVDPESEEDLPRMWNVEPDNVLEAGDIEVSLE